MEKGIEQGIERGIEQGIEKGIEKGKSGTLKSVAEKLREMGLTDEQIREATSI